MGFCVTSRKIYNKSRSNQKLIFNTKSWNSSLKWSSLLNPALHFLSWNNYLLRPFVELHFFKKWKSYCYYRLSLRQSYLVSVELLYWGGKQKTFVTIKQKKNTFRVNKKNPLNVTKGRLYINVLGHCFSQTTGLTHSWQRFLSYRNQSIDLLCKSKDWFLCDRHPRHKRAKFHSKGTKKRL